MQEQNLSHCHITATHRQTSGSLSNMLSIDNLQTTDDGSAHKLWLVWRFRRVVQISSQLLEISQRDETFPGFSNFCAQVFSKRPSSKIASLPLIPVSSTNPAVLKEELVRIVKTSQVLGDNWTIVTGDQATYELAMAVRDQNRNKIYILVSMQIP